MKEKLKLTEVWFKIVLLFVFSGFYILAIPYPQESGQFPQLLAAISLILTLAALAADFLRAQVYVEQALVPRFPDVHVLDLQGAWRDILKRAKLVQHHKISREELSVREHMSIVLRKLQGQRFVEFGDLFDPTRGSQVLVVTFIAMLELAKETLIELTQAEAFAPIYVRLAYSPN